jgi:aldehyde dehydrogenase
VAERARVLSKIADRIEENLELLATRETLDNDKPIRETTAADVPLAAVHFRYFAGCLRSHGRSSGKMMLDHYQQTKNLLVSYSPKALGFF